MKLKTQEIIDLILACDELMEQLYFDSNAASKERYYRLYDLRRKLKIEKLNRI